MSGLPMVQPSAICGIFGMSAMSPLGAPPSIHETIVSISLSVRRGSLRNTPCGMSEPHGGIVFAETRCLIDRSHGRASSYVVSDIGANIVARWHSTHDLYKIGATSLVNVGVVLSAARAAVGRARNNPKSSFFIGQSFYLGRACFWTQRT